MFLAWILVCFVPWARELPKISKKAASKKQPSPACLAAREGLKADNKVCKVVDSAAHHLQGVIDLRGSIPKQGSIAREIHGQAIRAWGSDWRSVVIFALLTEGMEAKTSNGMPSAANIVCKTDWIKKETTSLKIMLTGCANWCL